MIEPVPTARRENTRMRRRSPTAVRWVPPDEIALSLQSYWIAFSVPPMPLPDDHLSLLLLVQGTKFGLGVDLAKRRSSSLFLATRISGQIPDFVNKVRDLPGVLKTHLSKLRVNVRLSPSLASKQVSKHKVSPMETLAG